MSKSFIRKIGSTVAAVSLAIGLTMVQPAQAMGDIVETAANAGSFKTLLAAAQAAGLLDTPKAKDRLPCSRLPMTRPFRPERSSHC
jgi:hypothetical protein